MIDYFRSIGMYNSINFNSCGFGYYGCELYVFECSIVSRLVFYCWC